MATVYTRGNKLWIQYYVDGLQMRQSLNLIDNRENRKTAKKLAKQIEVDVDNGIFRDRKKKIKKGKPTLTIGFREFLKSKEKKSQQTISAYNSAHKRFLDFAGDIKIIKINNELTEKFAREIKYKLTERTIIMDGKKAKILVKVELSPNTIECYFRHLRIIFEFYKEKNYIQVNPFPIREKVEKEVKIVPPSILEDVLERLKKANREHYKVIQLFLLTGLRASELVNLSFKDIDFTHNYINIYNSKGRRKDKFPLYKKLRDFLLTEWETQEGKLFNYTSRDSLKFFGRFLKREGFPHYSIHTLRKTFLSNLVNTGLSLYDIKTIARHKDIRTTMKFYLSADMKRIGEKINDAVEISTKLSTVKKSHLKIVNE